MKSDTSTTSATQRQKNRRDDGKPKVNTKTQNKKTDDGPKKEQADNQLSKDPVLQRKVQQLMEMTECSEEAAIFALYETEDIAQAAHVLLDSGDSIVENMGFVTNQKRKSEINKKSNKGSGEPENGFTDEQTDQTDSNRTDRSTDRQTHRNTPPRMRKGRGGFTNRDGDDRGGFDRGGRGGRGRGGYSNRGGRGGRYNGGFGRGGGSGRERHTDFNQPGGNKPDVTSIGTWDNELNDPKTDSWQTADDFTGSLKTTHVFESSSKNTTSDTFPTPTAFDPSAPAAQPGSEPVNPVSAVNNTVNTVNLINSVTVTQNPPEMQPQPLEDFPKATVERLTNTVESSVITQPSAYQNVIGSSAGSNIIGSSVGSNVNIAVGSAPKPAIQKPLRSKVPPPSNRIPKSAVEMPNNAKTNSSQDKSSLSYSFGCFDLNSEPVPYDSSIDPAVVTAVTAPTSLYNANSNTPEPIAYPTSHSNTVPQVSQNQSQSVQPTQLKQDPQSLMQQQPNNPTRSPHPTLSQPSLVLNSSSYQQSQNQPRQQTVSSSQNYYQTPNNSSVNSSANTYNSTYNSEPHSQSAYQYQYNTTNTNSLASNQTTTTTRQATLPSAGVSKAPPNLPPPTQPQQPTILNAGQPNLTNYMAGHQIAPVYPAMYMDEVNRLQQTGQQHPHYPVYEYQQATVVTSAQGVTSSADGSMAHRVVDAQSPQTASTQHNQSLSGQQSVQGYPVAGYPGYNIGMYAAYGVPYQPVLQPAAMASNQVTNTAYSKGTTANPTMGYYSSTGAYEHDQHEFKSQLYSSTNNTANQSAMRQSNNSNSANDMSMYKAAGTGNQMVGSATNSYSGGQYGMMPNSQHMMQDKSMGGRSGHASMKTLKSNGNNWPTNY